MAALVPEVSINSCDKTMPIIGLGTAVYFSDENDRRIKKDAFIEAIKAGYRHFDTAAEYPSEQPLGEVIIEALRLGLIKSRDELFITSKIGARSADKDLVLPAIKKSLRNLQLDYLDLCLIHVPYKLSPDVEWPGGWPVPSHKVFPLDMKGVWERMEECKNLGLTKAIGVSNFSCKKLEELLSIAKIPPAVNQVEMSPTWQQKQLREFCEEKGIHITAYSSLGAYKDIWGHKTIIENSMLEEIAKARGKTTAQIALRWVYEQGVSLVPKSFNKERMRQNLQILDWCLTKEESAKISQIPQQKQILISKALGLSTDWIHELDAADEI